jgi:magnesium transporter
MASELVQRCAADYLRRYPAEASLVLSEMTGPDVAEALEDLDPAVADSLLRRLTLDQAALALCAMPEGTASAILTLGDFVQVARWLNQCSKEDRARLMALLPERLARDVESVGEYPAGSAGQLMDGRFVTFRPGATVQQVLSRIRDVSDRRITDVISTDSEGRLTRTISLQSIVGANPTETLENLPDMDPVFVSPLASQDEVVELMRTHNLASLPVVDHDNVVIGILRHGALVKAAQAQALGDLQQMVGASDEERALSPPTAAIKSRLPWLLINLGTAFAAASVVGLFDATIARFTALAVLMPVVAGQSGNTGAQALAVTSRGLALREVRVGHWLRVVGKELLAAGANGIAISLVTGVAVYIWSGSAGLVAVIAIAMVVSMLTAALAGAAIPMLLTALKRDPAVASSIILTTVTDIVGFFSFLGLATLLADWLS